MKQILQNLKNGTTILEEHPSPGLRSGCLLIKSKVSLISTGTEKMLVDFGRANVLNKVRQQPDKVRMVLDKVRTDGFSSTLSAVQSKLDQPLTLGYCNVGLVQSCHSGTGFQEGDRVVSNGQHAEIVTVPQNLCARIPDIVSDDYAAFTVVAAIGLQGIRLINPTLGECVVVTGLGLIGLITVQLLRAQGCRVLGIDFDHSRLELAKQFGAEVVNPSVVEDVAIAANRFSRGRGVDAVIITASTKSNEPVSQAANMCRKRGRIVLVGVTGLELSRADFYEKELTFQVSCSYGPGRYDPAYEEQGHDYPVGFVRWTEQRNFEAVLDLMASGDLNLDPLISHRFNLQDSVAAYDLLSSGEPSLGILIQYSEEADINQTVIKLPGNSNARVAPSKMISTVGFLGAGNYAGRVLIPAFKATGAQLHTIVSGGGVSSVHYGKKYDFKEAATDSQVLFVNSIINTVIIATRHHSHALQVLDSLRANKHVFCEKPLCLTMDELFSIQTEAELRPEQLLMVGFNRRFAPQIAVIKKLLDTVDQPKNLIMTVNAGEIPCEHWTQDTAVGGGRIIGEACHFIDLLRYLVGATIVGHQSISLGEHASLSVRDDKATITLSFADGSVGTIHYFANGHRSFPKERLEVFCAGRILQLDNFRKFKSYGWPSVKNKHLWRQDKGQVACATEFVKAIQEGKPSPIPLSEILEVSRVSIEIAEQLRG